ncbi:hypothetical protein K2173_020653 [Erythroxylum novogranatense]|uniref:indole-3-pyruvate monooxygenase n=1 Tax=Erythroxylum novogranatense TaxID=1862640 RepID=A0AAV8TLS6_9ROSI|nr:hypothetical protein K2173_020653 [Erythroxylum novogranatense]
MEVKKEVVVLIVGAGPSGLATSVCLSKLSVPNIILEKEDCAGSLWKKRAYDRLHLHLAKKYCELPYMQYPPNTDTFMRKDVFIKYLDDYQAQFDVKPLYRRCVHQNGLSSETETYIAKFIVVATGENSQPFVPQFPGMESFNGEMVHSSEYKNGSVYRDRKVLVVGCGNSGMEISYDLASYGAKTSIVVRSPFHVLNKDLVYTMMNLLSFLPMKLVDVIAVFLSRLAYGNLTPVVDVGTVQKIREGAIRVVQGVASFDGNFVEFTNGIKEAFDVIVFATGYRSSATEWLQDYGFVLNEKGLPKTPFPKHWKGENGVYCAGLSRMGLGGVSNDAKAIAEDIKKLITSLVTGKGIEY